MGRKIILGGFFGGDFDKPEAVNLAVTITGSGMSEMLVLECQGQYGLTVPYRPIERLAREAFSQSAQHVNAVEPSVRIPAQSADRKKGTVTAHMRMRGNFMMLTLEYMEMGQMSVPFAPIEKMVRAERSTYA